MTCTSVFEHPSKGIYHYGFSRPDAKAESDYALGFDGNEHFGRYLYSRPVGQVVMKTGQSYELRFSANQATLKYRLESEALFGHFDYFREQGNHGDVVRLLVDHVVEIPDLGVTAPVRLCFALRGVRSFKFADFCKIYRFTVEIKNAEAVLVGRSFGSADIHIPLTLVRR